MDARALYLTDLPGGCGETGGPNPYSRETWNAPAPPRRAAGPEPRGRGAADGGAVVRSRQRIDGRRAVTLVAAAGLVVFLVAAVLQAAGLYAGAADEAAPAGAGGLVPATVSVSGDGAEAASTPKSQWQAGELPFLYQTDPAYSAAPYAGADVGESGCGPTSLAMVYVALTGKTDYDPVALAAFSEENGFVEEGLTAWRLMTEGAGMLGLSSHEVPADAAALRSELEAGHPVICTVRPGDFTDTGHFLVVAGLAENGELVIHDPNSPANSARTWDIDRVLSQCANLWAFE